MFNPMIPATAVILPLLLICRSVEADDLTVRKKPFVDVPDTVSPEARKYLESLPDPASLPSRPEPDELPGWKLAWKAGETASEPKVEATLKRFGPTIKERKIGGVPVLDIKPNGWTVSKRVLVHADGGAYTMYSARACRVACRRHRQPACA